MYLYSLTDAYWALIFVVNSLFSLVICMSLHLELLGKSKCYFTLEQLRAFVVVAQTGSYTEAARFLRKDRTTLREHIENLEIDFNLTLLSKEGKRITLTENGTVVLRGAHSLLLAAESLNNLANSLSNEEVKHVNIMLDKHFPEQIVTSIEQDIVEAYPNVTIHWSHSTNENSMASLAKGEVDIAVMQHRAWHSSRHPPAGTSMCFLGNVEGAIFARNLSPLHSLSVVTMSDLTYEDRLIYDGDLEDAKAHTSGLPTNYQIFSSKGLLLSCLKVKGWTYLPYLSVPSDMLEHISPVNCDFINDSWSTGHILLQNQAPKSSPISYIAEKIKSHYKQYSERGKSDLFKQLESHRLHLGG